MATVLRTWKRDGSMNELSIEAAAANLRDHGLTALQGATRETVGVRGWKTCTIARRLARGESLETRNAVFRLARQLEVRS